MNNKSVIYIVVIVVVVAIGVFLWVRMASAPATDFNITNEENVPEENNLTAENAELVAFGFIQDFIKIAPPEPDSEAIERVWNSLSSSAKSKVSREYLSRDIAGLVGVQDVPDLGASVEDLQITSSSNASLIVGLNYSGGQVVRAINLVAENGVWKVDSVSVPEFWKI